MWTEPFAARNLFPTMHILAPLPGYKLPPPALRHAPRRLLCSGDLGPRKIFNLWLRVLSTYRWVIIIKGAAWTRFTIFEVHGNI
jgi:hypothetical protein